MLEKRGDRKMSELEWTVILGVLSMLLGMVLNIATKPRMRKEVAD